MPSKSIDMVELEMGVVEGTRSSETENGSVCTSGSDMLGLATTSRCSSSIVVHL